MAEVILRSEAWKLIDSGVLFDIAFVTANRRKGTGGKFIELKGAQKVQQKIAHAGAGKPPIRPLQKLKKDPNHGVNKTVNIHIPHRAAIHMHKVHYRLFTRLNGKTVIQ